MRYASDEGRDNRSRERECPRGFGEDVNGSSTGHGKILQKRGCEVVVNSLTSNLAAMKEARPADLRQSNSMLSCAFLSSRSQYHHQSDNSDNSDGVYRIDQIDSFERFEDPQTYYKL